MTRFDPRPDRWWQILHDCSPEVFVVVDGDGIIRWYSPNAPTVLGHGPDDLTGGPYTGLTTHRSFDDVIRPLGPQYHLVRGKDGSARDLLATVSDRRGDGVIDGWVITLRDIGGDPATARLLRHYVTRDPLTDLPTRSLLMEHLRAAIARLRRRPGHVAALFLDLDGFKEVNDRLGHDAGDALLTGIANRLRTTVRTTDVVARLGGDEFVIVVDAMNDPADAALVGEKVLAAIVEPISVGDCEARVGASIGIAVTSDPAASADQLLADADAAMYHVKHSGKHGVVDFGDLVRAVAADRDDLQVALQKALLSEQIELLYESIVGLDSGQVRGFLVSLRWQHPDRGPLADDQWLRLAHQVDMGTDVDDWFLVAAFEQARLWRFAGKQVVSWLPATTHQLLRPGFVASVSMALQSVGAAAEDVGFRVSETTLARSPEAIATTLDELSNLGVRLAIDGFRGNGLSPDLMQDLPVDQVMLDPSFVRRVGRDQRAGRSIAGLVSMARHVGVQVCAAGVDTPSQLATVLQLRCVSGAGEVFTSALPAEAASATLRPGHVWNLPLRLPDAAGSDTIAGLGSPAAARILAEAESARWAPPETR